MPSGLVPTCSLWADRAGSGSSLCASAPVATHAWSQRAAANRPVELAKVVKENSRVSVVELDVADEVSVRKAASTASALFDGAPKLTHIIHNAGIVGEQSDLGDVRAEDMLSVFRVNAFGVVNVVQAFMPLLKPPQGRKKPVIAVLSSKVASVDVTQAVGSMRIVRVRARATSYAKVSL